MRRTAFGVGLALAVWVGPAAGTDPVEPGPAGPERAAARLGLTIDRAEPMKIDAEQLDYDEPESRVVFQGSVRVSQGDLHLSCDWLEAIYPDGAGGSPRRITARGTVRITQAEAEVTCEEAVLDNERCQVICATPEAAATLRRGCDVVEGREMHFDLCNGKLKVRGRSSIYVDPECAAGEAGSGG